MTLHSRIGSQNIIKANITLDVPTSCTLTSKCGRGLEALTLRLRTPGKRSIVKVLVGGENWLIFDNDAETISFRSAGLYHDGIFNSKLQDIVVTYS